MSAVDDEEITPNFRRSEVACRCGCGFADIDMLFMHNVQRLREAFGRPMIVLSGCRCKDHNKDVGGSKNSYHLAGRALDIRVDSNSERHKLVRLAAMIFNGVGVHNGYVHIDARESIPVMWVY